MHLHLLGRSRTAADPDLRWGEAPRFRDFARRHAWAAGYARLTPAECRAVAGRARELLCSRYGLAAAEMGEWRDCAGCGWPTPREPQSGAQDRCVECGGR